MTHHSHSASRGASAGLTLAALGVVFGDIGTSPLYAMKEVFSGAHRFTPDPGRIYGVISLVFWSLIIIVTLKYVVLIMRADNQGEGGIMALVALVKRIPSSARIGGGLILLGIFGASLFYGDGMITPAISVLSAVEGLEVASPGIDSLVVPMALAILTGLFAVQRFGTGAVGRLFGPVMLAWFTTLGVLGVMEIRVHPGVLQSLSPTYAVRFFVDNGSLAFLALGSVVLAVTGAEALYADMGHFGRPAITRAWLLIAFPALLLNYMGQGALLVNEPAARDNPFYRLAPEWGQIPLVVLATCATVVASQAVISGAFSVTRQAIQLGFLPRMAVRHTSADEAGQIYVPAINWLLYVAVFALVLGFQSSSNLASAYGIAVTATLAIDTLLAFYVIRQLWGKPVWMVALGVTGFLVVDLAFFAANTTKILHGGWFPILMGLVAFTMLSTWWRGRRLALRRLAEREMPLKKFIQLLRAQWARSIPGIPLTRVPGTAVYLTAIDGGTPMPLNRNLEHNHVLHQRIVLFTSRVRGVPLIGDDERLEVSELGQGIVRVVASYGFQEQPNVPAALRLAAAHGLDVDPDHASYFLGHVTLNPVDGEGMALWRKKLFAWMSKNSFRASTYLGVKSDEVIEVGTQVDI
ncbi:MAG: potassium transporter Kup [Thermoleophilia bacterium]|nr:potassium transporter Kup [Thermoleophilia bacterium]